MKRNLRLHLFLAFIFVLFFCCNRAQQQQPQTEQPQQTPQTESQIQKETPAHSTPSTSSQPSVAQNSNPPEAASTPSASPEQQPINSTAPHFRMPAFWENPDSAGVLEPTLDPTTVPVEAQAAYLIAQQKPKLLSQMPCFCYCDRFGHKSLHDCYVSTHAQQCDVCLQEAIEADQMDKQGMSPEEIRAVIIAKHHPPS